MFLFLFLEEEKGGKGGGEGNTSAACMSKIPGRALSLLQTVP